MYVMKINIEISKIIDKYLPVNDVGCSQENIRMEMFNDIMTLINNEKTISHFIDENGNAVDVNAGGC